MTYTFKNVRKKTLWKLIFFFFKCLIGFRQLSCDSVIMILLKSFVLLFSLDDQPNE